MTAVPAPRSVLVLNPWDGGSHAAWAHGWARHSRHHVRVVGLPAAAWRWRLRGGAVSLAEGARAAVDAAGPPDVVVATDFVDLSAFCGFARRWLGRPALAVYLHESQLVRPTGHRPGRAAPAGVDGDDDVDAGSGAAPSEAVWANWRSMVAADAVLVNSRHHLDTLAGALPALLASTPEPTHAHLLDEVLGRTAVLPVGCELAALLASDRRSTAPPAGTAAPLVVWNQRWDHDKAPEAFLRVLVRLADEGVAFRVALVGENRRRDPREFTEARAVLGDRVVAFGHQPEDDYRDLLLRGDVVMSTAVHEFFGVAPVEAMAAGCVPVLPDRCSYPEQVPAAWHDAVLYRNRPKDHLAAVLADPAAARRRVVGLRESMARFSWEAVAPAYDETVDRLAADYGPAS